MKTYLLVFLGGGIGSCLRFYFSLIENNNGIKWFPTLGVNTLGCLLLGCFIAAFQREHLSNQWFILLGVGFCGGLTTFSTFSTELFTLLKSSSYYSAISYLALSIIFGIIAAAAGYYFIDRIIEASTDI